MVPDSAAATTASAFGCPRATSSVPSSGSTATSTLTPEPVPIRSPLKSIGASSFSPSPITTTPSISTVASMCRIASTAAWSAASLSPNPTQRAEASAAASVTRTSSSARFRSGASGIAREDTPLTLAALDADRRDLLEQLVGRVQADRRDVRRDRVEHVLPAGHDRVAERLDVGHADDPELDDVLGVRGVLEQHELETRGHAAHVLVHLPAGVHVGVERSRLQ